MLVSSPTFSPAAPRSLRLRLRASTPPPAGMVFELKSTPLSFPRTRICLRPPSPVATVLGISTTASPPFNSGRKYRIVPRNRDAAAIEVVSLILHPGHRTASFRRPVVFTAGTMVGRSFRNANQELILFGKPLRL